MLHVDNFNNNILTNINFSLNDKENLTILGSNGAGKSTLAKLLCGIIYSESVETFNEKLHTISAKKRASLINYVPPKLEIFDEYISLREYLELGRLYSKLSVDKVLEILELTHLQNKRCISLSSGEAQLTLIASAILHGAKLTIFDEPTSNLDPQKTVMVAKILQSDMIQNRVIITHDLNFAHKLGYKTIYMLNGEILFFDTSENFFIDSNLEKLFNKSVKRVDDYFVVNL